MCVVKKVSLLMSMLVGVFFLSGAIAAEKLVIKSGDVHGQGYPTVEAIRYMGEKLSAWTNGRISVVLYGKSQLGAEKEMFSFHASSSC